MLCRILCRTYPIYEGELSAKAMQVIRLPPDNTIIVGHTDHIHDQNYARGGLFCFFFFFFFFSLRFRHFTSFRFFF